MNNIFLDILLILNYDFYLFFKFKMITFISIRYLNFNQLNNINKFKFGCYFINLIFDI